MPSLLYPVTPSRKAVRTPCKVCNGTGKMASEWDLRTGAVVAFAPCTSCLAQGWGLETPKPGDVVPASEWAL